ncbi:MAG: hypothetical protein GY893_14005, partial [bacterium]|nr:hypothetical protein [bacterium]
NVAIGNYAADALTSGDKNVIVGHSAATAVTAMTNSVVMGFEAMEATTGGGGGNESVVIGSMAHKDDAAGSANVSLGYMAARYATSGSMNVAIGHQAHLNSTAGNANTFVGTGAGKGQSSTTGGSYNVAIGESALRDHTTGGFNIAVGRDSATNITTGQGNVVIGRNTSTLTATSDSQLMIGSGLSTSCVWLTGTSDGSVNLPAAILKIAGSVGTDGQVLTSTGSAVAWEDAAGGGTTGYTWTDTAGSEQFLISDTSDTALFKVQNAGTGNAFEVHDQASDTSAFVVKNDGKVGILKNPSSSLTYDVEIGGETLSERFTSSVTGSASSPAFRFSGDSNTGMYNGGTDILGFSTDSTSRMTIAADGTVDVVGTLDTTNLTIGGAQGS